MTDLPVKRRCTECGNYDEDATYCPHCGNNEWGEYALYDFERDVNLPFVFPFVVYYDHYELWHSFCETVWDTRVGWDDIANRPELPRMKYSQFEVYFKLTEGYELTGPFVDREEARKA